MAKTPVRAEWKRRQRRKRLGWALMLLGAVVLATHLGWHVVANPPGIADIVAGYPAGGFIFVVGAVILG